MIINHDSKFKVEFTVSILIEKSDKISYNRFFNSIWVENSKHDIYAEYHQFQKSFNNLTEAMQLFLTVKSQNIDSTLIAEYTYDNKFVSEEIISDTQINISQYADEKLK